MLVLVPTVVYSKNVFTATANSEIWKVSEERRLEKFAVSTKIGADENPQPTPFIVPKHDSPNRFYFVDFSTDSKHMIKCPILTV